MGPVGNKLIKFVRGEFERYLEGDLEDNQIPKDFYEGKVENSLMTGAEE